MIFPDNINEAMRMMKASTRIWNAALNLVTELL